MTHQQSQAQPHPPRRKAGQKPGRPLANQAPAPSAQKQPLHKGSKGAERAAPGRKPAARRLATARPLVAHHTAQADGRTPLWQQLQQAARLVQAVMQGSSAPTVLDELPPAQRAGVQALGYLALRRLGMARWLREQLVPRTPPPAVDALLCTALALAWEPTRAASLAAPQAPDGTPAKAADWPAGFAPEAAYQADGAPDRLPTVAALAQGQGVDSRSEPAAQPPSAAGPSAPAAASPAQADAAPYNDFTLAHQAVEAARRHPRMRHQAGLVNACLRTFMRERALWQARCAQAAPQGRAELLNLPAWWWQRLQADYPEATATKAATHAAADAADAANTTAPATSAAQPQPPAISTAAAIALAGQHPPPMHLRVNVRHLSPAQYLQDHLLPAGLAGQLHGDYGVLLHKPCPVQQLPGFAQGWVSVQDAAAQLAAPLLLNALRAQPDAELGRGLRLLDACAAPGGKTAHLLELGAHEVMALEIDAARCARISENLQRLGLSAQVRVADAGQPAAWWDGQLFDGILLDAPCSASGIVRRHPDIAWLRREVDIAQLARTQRQLLQALWPLLRPGGVLLYATCSVFRAEGQDQVDAFLARHNDAACLPAPGHLLPSSGLAAAGLGHNGPQAGAAQAGAEQAPLHAVPPAPFLQPSSQSAAQSAAQAAGAACAPQWLDHDGFYYALLVKIV